MSYSACDFVEDITSQLNCYDEDGDPDDLRLQSVVAGQRIDDMRACVALLRRLEKYIPADLRASLGAQATVALAAVDRTPQQILQDAGELDVEDEDEN